MFSNDFQYNVALTIQVCGEDEGVSVTNKSEKKERL